MPIGADRFEEIDGDADSAPRTNAYEIVTFLAENADQAFTQSEIAAATDVARGSIGPTLVRLREDGRVDHAGTYWRISDHELSVRSATELGAGSVASRESIPFEYDEWEDHAVDPRESRE